jgi:hypothetical protein
MDDNRVGQFEVNTSSGGYPVWCELSRNWGGGVQSLGRFDHRQLRDLEYAVKKLIRQAKVCLPDINKDEV